MRVHFPLWNSSPSASSWAQASGERCGWVVLEQTCLSFEGMVFAIVFLLAMSVGSSVCVGGRAGGGGFTQEKLHVLLGHDSCKHL